MVAGDDVPVIEVEGRGRLSLGALKELWQFREVLGAFTARQIKVRYKQASIGIGWAVLQPVLSAVLFAVFLGSVAKIPSEGLPYLLFALSGMVCWTFFSGAAGQAMESLVADQALLRKVYFPREILPLAGVAAALVDLVPAMAILAVFAAASGFTPGLTWLALPIPILLMVVSAAALGLVLSGINAYYRDARHALPFVLQIGLFASPVVWSLSEIPERWRFVYSVANPVAAGIDGVRRVTLHSQWPDPVVTLAALAWSAAGLGVGYYFFKRLERGITDRV